MSGTTVIVGASVGGVRTAQALRAAHYDGDIVLVGDETVPPYDKPPLSKALLSGQRSATDIALLSEQDVARDRIRLELGRAATGVDLDDKTVKLADGASIHFDDLVVATGARARPSPWGQPPGVYALRTLDDAAALRESLRGGGPLVVVGAGFIGSEVAATARGMGVNDITVVDPMRMPLSRVLNPEVAAEFARLHEARGVATRFGAGVVGIDTVEHAQARLAVHLTDGVTLPADTVVVGIGAIPNDGWLRGSGLKLEHGVVCDEYSRVVGHPHVHAVGDVARWRHPRHGRLVRLEHWTNAVEQAACVAHNIAHPDDRRTHAPVEYIWSDQYDWKVQLAGRTGGGLSHIRIDGAEPSRSFAVLYSDPGGGFAGALTVNWPRAILACRRALAAPVSLASVRDAVLDALKPRAERPAVG